MPWHFSVRFLLPCVNTYECEFLNTCIDIIRNSKFEAFAGV